MFIGRGFLPKTEQFGLVGSCGGGAVYGIVAVDGVIVAGDRAGRQRKGLPCRQSLCG